ncbi:androgen-dependent TFPI-regulating protein-like isoform X2 [Pararge aegeria]|uniref:Jg10343 protein n=1 Tax=Pararge aegeria aegeria TaxID=348720 RepID=A0A8S4RPH6_9NEOP|nr:androgen-dependent TFPI-regulating protein-like isoform X2 [Pararge aegeria]XP_039748156.1 androgen-dependent TFPI-regulating protein-like isoform X2 [Pararge aegeria]CAH2238021.1 jg10343 [Pararge aegeria aegeria]
MGAITFHVHCRIIGSAIALLLHGGNSIAMFFAMRGDILKDPDIANLQATQYRYLTIWNVAFQIAYSIMNLACDIPLFLKVKEESSPILCYLEYVRKYRKVVFGGVIFPTGVAIFTVFWPIFIYNRELIFPKFIDKAISPVSNQIMHSAIFFIVMWELLFHPRAKPSSHKLYLGHMAVIFFSYFIVLFANYAERGTWPYPLFTIVYGTIYFPLLLAALCIIYVSAYFIQWPLTSLVYNNITCKKTEKIR